MKLSGFGNFDLRQKNQRPGRNPKTGEEIPISAPSRGHVPSGPKTESQSRILCWIKAVTANCRSIPAKRYFTIGEVSDLCGVKPHVLRYWEQEFTQPQAGQASRQPPLLPAPRCAA